MLATTQSPLLMFKLAFVAVVELLTQMFCRTTENLGCVLEPTVALA